MEPLVAADDADWIAFQDDDPDFFLKAAGDAVRKYCGWHIAPNITETLGNLKIGSQNIIMLPSRYVTAVSEVIIMTGQDADAQTGTRISPGNYMWHRGGWLQRKGAAWWADWFLGGYYYGSSPYYLPVAEPGYAQCTFSHGYEELPADVKAVVFELAEAAKEMSSGNLKMVSAPNGFRLTLSQAAGLNMNDFQKDRLANYRIGMIA